MSHKYSRATRRFHAARVRARKRKLVARLGYTVEVTGEAHADYLLRWAHKSRACHKFPRQFPGLGVMARDMRAVPAPDFPEPVLHANLVPHRDYWERWGTACERMADAFRSEIEWEAWERELEDDAPLVDIDADVDDSESARTHHPANDGYDDLDGWLCALTFEQLMVQKRSA